MIPKVTPKSNANTKMAIEERKWNAIITLFAPKEILKEEIKKQRGKERKRKQMENGGLYPITSTIPLHIK